MEILSNLFVPDIEKIGKQVKKKRMINYAAIAASLSLSSTSFLVPNQPQILKLLEMGGASLIALASAYVAKKGEDIEKIIQVYEKLNREHYTQDTKNKFNANMLLSDMNRDKSLAYKLSGIEVKGYHPIAQMQYAEKFGLPSGLFPHIVNQSVEAKQEDTDMSVTKAKVATASQELQDTIINPKIKAILNQLATQYPGYVRIDAKWIDELVRSSANPKMSRRKNHNFYFCGETQSGKSTLAGVFINLICNLSQSEALVYGHDPKKKPKGMDVTKWLCDFTHKVDGFEGTADWIKLYQKESDAQNDRVSLVGNTCEGVPEIIFLQDEVDSLYNQGEGFPPHVTKEMVKEIQGCWLHGTKFMAGLKGHMFFMGQSPLSGDNGFKRPTLKNFCFIAMGQTSSYVLSNPKDFLNHVTDDLIKLLTSVCELFEKNGLRYALVRPTDGNPYVALIPNFNLDAIINGKSVENIVLDDEEEIQAVEAKKTEIDNEFGYDVEIPLSVTTKHEENLDSENSPASPDTPNIAVTINKMLKWVQLCYDTYGRYPKRIDIKNAWHKETGLELSEEAVTLLMEKFGIESNN